MEVSCWRKGVVHGGGRDERGPGPECIHVHAITDSKAAQNGTKNSGLATPF